VIAGVGPAHADEPASSAEYTLTENSLTIKTSAGTRDVPLPDCEPKGVERGGSRLYVACGASGILVLDAVDPAAPVVRGRIPTDGDAVGVHAANGKVWVEIAHVEARSVDTLARAAHAGAGASGTAAAPPPTTPEAAAAQDARPSLLAPPRRTDITELAADARVFLPIGNLGFGALSSLSVTHRFDAPVAIHGELSPLGVAAAKQGLIGTAAANAIVAFDVHLFEVGIGIGAATLNDPLGTAESSVSFPQYARLGARDGLSFGIRSNVVINRDKFELGSLSGDGEIPLGQRWWLAIRGGGGPIGFAYGDLGVRYLIFGELGPGSLLFVGSVGGAGIFKTRACAFPCNHLNADYAGPSLGFGLEWRL
jgi:hypothetical protein